jgi:hypothetical protein
MIVRMEAVQCGANALNECTCSLSVYQICFRLYLVLKLGCVLDRFTLLFYSYNV